MKISIPPLLPLVPSEENSGPPLQRMLNKEVIQENHLNSNPTMNQIQMPKYEQRFQKGIQLILKNHQRPQSSVIQNATRQYFQY